MRKGSAIALCAVLASGCTGVLNSYEIRSHSDPFTGAQYEFMRNNVLLSGEIGAARVELNFQRLIFEGDTSYQVFAEYRWSTWMFIDEGPSLIFLVDGERVALSGGGSRSTREVLSGGNVMERATYDISPAELWRLARATTVQVRVSGSRFNMDRAFESHNFVRLREFIAAYGPPPPAQQYGS